MKNKAKQPSTIRRAWEAAAAAIKATTVDGRVKQCAEKVKKEADDAE